MKKILSFGLLLIIQVCFGQAKNLIKVPGTKCSLIPPDGFVIASSFSGFQNNETGASIMINEIPGPYQSIIDGFTADALKMKGMTLIKKQTIDFKNSKATFFNVTQSANETNYLKQILAFGDAQQTILVNGIYPEVSKSVEPIIKDALLSTVCDQSQKESSLDAATFTVDISNTEFKPIKYMSGSLLYSTDGKIPTEKPILIVGNSLAKVSTQNQKKYAEERLKKLPNGNQSIIKQINKISIDNLNGYEIIADGKTKNNIPELIYQVMLFNNNGDYYMIVGQAKENFEKYLETFKKITKTFKRK
ncbi:hypothetical protein CHRYSEOSP005_29350 [Chryseobacterium sp. Alg-005]|uniref:PsbP-related protein n=1 Tax=Chryseobacterium sp. Alg-005 TaxID=3159516 RepID=UPI003555A050